VTALAFCGQYLLAAEGPFLRILDHDSAVLLLTKQIFDSQTIHGIVVHDTCSSTVVIIWGGRSLRLAQLRLPTASPVLEIEVNNVDIWLSHIAKVPDWILDFSLGPLKPQTSDNAFYHFKAAAITAHNALLELGLTYYDDSQHAPVDANG
jgi:WD repeat-containing protein 6